MNHADTYRYDAELFCYRQLTADQLQFYDEQGYLILKSLLTPHGLEMLREECMEAWESKKTEFDANKNWLQNSLLPNIHHYSPIARKYYFAGPLVDVAEQIIGPNIKGATSQLTFKMRGNSMPFGWHQDNGYGELEPYNAISMLTALDDADTKNGCLWLIPGSHRRGQIKANLTQSERSHQKKDLIVEVDETQAIPIPMQAGDALIFHCWMLHKSDGNLSSTRDRRILFLRYADADAMEVYNNHQPRLGRLLRGATQFPEVRDYESNLI